MQTIPCRGHVIELAAFPTPTDTPIGIGIGAHLSDEADESPMEIDAMDCPSNHRYKTIDEVSDGRDRDP